MRLEYRILGQLPDDITNGGEEYYDGFAEASHKAATLAAEADELMREMADVIKAFHVWAVEEDRLQAACLIDGVLRDYYKWKEQNQ